ncbi:MAG: sugar ABC transporter ATP-binding protein [Clostridiales bacterium]|nr:sugar ABC transporter ATP-binding protein [Clostridiales bacterium]OPZ67876.1 MAG: Ribose import ATP-binding protein RbsA [Firmicutes bacterium ADurb.Bin467]
MSDILVLDRINKSFPGVQALKDMSFSIREGEVHAICGENGAGKSTLMKVVSGVYAQDSGDIYVRGEKATIKNPIDAFEKGIAIMYQETSLFNEMTILENLFLNHEPTKKVLGVPVIDHRTMEKKVDEILRHMNVSMDINAKVRDIGMAQKQLVEIAKALTFDAKILIMDEPTASLTEREVTALFEIIRTLKNEGVSIVYISHRLEEIFEICDRVTVIRDGEFISCRETSETDKDRLVADMVGREVGSYYPKANTDVGGVLLELDGISQGNVLRDIRLSVRRGEIVGLSGLSGSGRTELAHAICGFSKLDGGEIRIEGRAVKIENYRKAMEMGIVYVSEDRAKYGLVAAMSIRGNISLPQIKSVSRRGFIDFDRERRMAEEAIEAFGIKAQGPDFPVENLSGGNQQKVSVARSTALRPKIMILDEPTRGVDVNAKAEIYRIIGELIKQGLSILMISSELPELLGMCDRIYVMNAGHIVSEFDREHATQESILKYALGEK